MKFLINLVLLIILAFMIFVVVAAMSGGRDFRWFGDMFYRGAYEVADKADRMKRIVDKTGGAIEQTTGRINNATESAAKTLKETKEKINEKADDISRLTGEKAVSIKRGINNSITNSIDAFKSEKDKHAGPASSDKSK